MLQRKRTSDGFWLVHSSCILWSVCWVANRSSSSDFSHPTTAYLLCWSVAQLCLVFASCWTLVVLTVSLFVVLHKRFWCCSLWNLQGMLHYSHLTQTHSHFTSFPSFTAYFTNSISQIIIHPKNMQFMERLAFFLLSWILHLLFCGLVESNLQYGDVVWGWAKQRK